MKKSKGKKIKVERTKIGSNKNGLGNISDDAYIKKPVVKGSLNGCLIQAENKVKEKTVKFTQKEIFGSK